MAKQADSIHRLATEFARMPGIGARTGERLAYHVQSVSPDEADRLVDAIRQVKASAVRCSKCFNISESDPCPVCSDPRRDGATLCVVERVRDVAVIESSGSYRGLYHVLGGHIAPLEDKHPENLTIDALERRLKEGKVREVIIATNPDTEGDATANFLCDRLARFDVTVSVLARGMPAGGQLEYAAQGTVAGAIAGRRTVEAK